MVDFDRLRVRFRQFGGWRLVMQYARMGVLWIGLKEIVKCAVKRKSMKAVYPVVTRKVDEMLVERYTPLLENYVRDVKAEKESLCQNASEEYGATSPVYVWWCWLQGEQDAPDLAKACLGSLRRNLTDVEIVVIDATNYSEWVTLPEYIENKYEKGIIPHVLFSDLLRIELLAKYGGVWIDSTVMLSSNETVRSSQNFTLRNEGDLNDEENKQVDTKVERSKYIPAWEDIVNAEVFVFQYTQPGYSWSGNISNWFIAAQKEHPFVLALRKVLLGYWKDYDCVVQYYIFHLFFAEIAKMMPEVIERMPYGWSLPCIELGKHLGDKFNAEQWAKFSRRYPWHKMSYRLKDSVLNDENNYYNYIIKS